MPLSDEEKAKIREEARQQMRGVLEGIPEIKFIGFEDFKILDNAPLPYAAPEDWVELVSTPIARIDAQTSSWIKDILKSENIHGQYLLLFIDKGKKGDAAWASVELSQNHDWVDPIWPLGHWIEICDLNNKYYYLFLTEESLGRAYKVKMFPTPRPWNGGKKGKMRT